MSIATTEPKTIQSGDRLQWRREDLSRDYPATEWDLEYAFVKDGAQLVINATADGLYFEIDEDSATTVGYAPGDYHWQAYTIHKSTSERETVDSGTVKILVNFQAQTAGYNAKSPNQQAFEAIEAALQGKATSAQKSYTLRDRSVESYGIKELERLRTIYGNAWDREKIRERKKNGGSTGLVTLSLEDA